MLGRTDEGPNVADSLQEKASDRLPTRVVMVVHVLFFFSGAAALVYEVVWMRLLSFVFGNTTYAVSVVLAVYLGGLAIGAMVYGRLADRRGNLLGLYGRLELVAAAIAVALPWVLLEVLTPVYTWVYRWAGESVVVLTLVRVVLSGCVLLLPTVLLGGTLPVLIRFLVRGDRGMEGHIGRLYGLNTLGAVAGSFAAGFLLLPDLGVRASSFVGAGIGLAVGAAAVLMQRALMNGAHFAPGARPAIAVADGERTRGQTEQGAVGGWLLTAFALSGFAALAYEVLWTRLLVFFTRSTVYAFSAMLCVYLLGLGLGSLAYSFFIARSRSQRTWFIVLEVLTGVAAACTVPTFVMLAGVQQRHMDTMTSTFQGYVSWILLMPIAIMIVPTFLIGALFPLVCALRARETGRLGGGIGEVYVVNTLGTVAGALSAGFLLVPWIGTRLALLAVAGLNVFAGLLVWCVSAGATTARAARAAVALAGPIALGLAVGAASTAEDLAAVYKHGQAGMFDIEWLNEGIDGTVTIETGIGESYTLTGMGKDRRLAINGVNVAGTRLDLHTTQKLQAHLGLLIRAGAERVLQIGFGSGGTAYAASLHPLDRLDCVEISRSVLQAAPRFEETNHGVLEDERVHLYVEDARSFIKHTPHNYDVILSDSTHPILAGEGLLYSVDYLRDCAAHLKPDGIFSTWLPIYGVRLEDVKVMVRSIHEVFPYTYIWHTSIARNEWCIVHGMKQPLRVDYERFSQEVAIPAVQRDLAQIHLDRPEVLLGLLLYGHAAVEEWVHDSAQLNTDDNGYLEFAGPKGAYRFPEARKVNFLFTYPALVLNARGSILDYVAGPGGDEASWRRSIRGEEVANRHVLNGRIHELAGGDAHLLLALMEYRRALSAAPNHYVAQTMIGVEAQQLEWSQAAAEGETTSLTALDQLVAAAIALADLDDAARYARMMATHRRATPGPATVVAVLRGDWEEVRRLPSTAPGSGEGLVHLGMGREAFSRAVLRAADAERKIATEPGNPEGWRRSADVHREMAISISRNTAPVKGASAALALRGCRLHAIAALADLSRERYEKALEIDPEDVLARYQLAWVLASQGEYESGVELLRGIDPESVSESDTGVSSRALEELIADLQAQQRDPFSFVRHMQQAMLARASGRAS